MTHHFSTPDPEFLRRQLEELNHDQKLVAQVLSELAGQPLLSEELLSIVPEDQESGLDGSACFARIPPELQDRSNQFGRFWTAPSDRLTPLELSCLLAERLPIPGCGCGLCVQFSEFATLFELLFAERGALLEQSETENTPNSCQLCFSEEDREQLNQQVLRQQKELAEKGAELRTLEAESYRRGELAARRYSEIRSLRRDNERLSSALAKAERDAREAKMEKRDAAELEGENLRLKARIVHLEHRPPHEALGSTSHIADGTDLDQFPEEVHCADQLLDVVRDRFPRVVIPKSAEGFARMQLGSADLELIWEFARRAEESARAKCSISKNTFSELDGHGVTFAPTESKRVADRNRKRAPKGDWSRWFWVTGDVESRQVPRDSQGRTRMLAHVKRRRNGLRIYFLDDILGATGQVHVGYIGPHLRTFNTS